MADQTEYIDIDFGPGLKELQKVESAVARLSKQVKRFEDNTENGIVRKFNSKYKQMQTMIRMLENTNSLSSKVANAQERAQRNEVRPLQNRINIKDQQIAAETNRLEQTRLMIQRQQLIMEKEMLRTGSASGMIYQQANRKRKELLETQKRITDEVREENRLRKHSDFINNRDGSMTRGTQASIASTKDKFFGSGAQGMFQIQAGLLSNFMVLGSIMGAARFTTQFLIDFDAALKDVQAITASSDTTMKGFKETIEEVASVTKFTAVEVAEAAKVLGQAGFAADQVAASLDSVAKFASATGIQMTEAVDIMTSALSVFNMRASESNFIADAFTAAVNNSKLNIQKLALGFQYSANIANQSNISFTELTTTLGLLADAGLRSGSTIGTNLRAMIIDLQTPSDKMIAILEKFNLSLADVDISSRGIIPVIREMRDAGFGASEAFSTMETRSAAAFLALSNQVDNANTLKEALVANSAAADASATQMESLKNTLANFQSVFGTTALNMFGPVVEVMQQLVEATNNLMLLSEDLAPVLGALGAIVSVRLVTALGNYILKIAGLTGGMAGLQKASVGANFAFKRQIVTMRRLSTTGKVLRMSMLGLNGAFALMGGPLGVLIAAIGVAAFAYSRFSKKNQDLKEALDKTEAQLASAESALESNKQAMESLDDILLDLIGKEEQLRIGTDQHAETVAELNDRYGDLGLSLNRLEDDYDSILGKVRDLRNEMREASAESAQLVYEGLVAKNEQTRQLIAADNRITGNADVFAEGANLDATVGVFSVPLADLLQVQNNLLGKLARQGVSANSQEEIENSLQRLRELSSYYAEVVKTKGLSDNQRAHASEAISIISQWIDDLNGAARDLRAQGIAKETSDLQNLRAEIGTAVAEGTESLAEDVKRLFTDIDSGDTGSIRYGLSDMESRAELSQPAMAALMDRIDTELERIDSLTGDQAEVANFMGLPAQLEGLKNKIRKKGNQIYEMADSQVTSSLDLALAEAKEQLSRAQNGVKTSDNYNELTAARNEVAAAAVRVAEIELEKQAHDMELLPGQYSVQNGQLRITRNDRPMTPTEDNQLRLANMEAQRSIDNAQNQARQQWEKITDEMRSLEVETIARDISNLTESIDKVFSELPEGFTEGAAQSEYDRLIELTTRLAEQERLKVQTELSNRTITPFQAQRRRQDIETDRQQRIQEGRQALNDKLSVARISATERTISALGVEMENALEFLEDKDNIITREDVEQGFGHAKRVLEQIARQEERILQLRLENNEISKEQYELELALLRDKTESDRRGLSNDYRAAQHKTAAGSMGQAFESIRHEFRELMNMPDDPNMFGFANTFKDTFIAAITESQSAMSRFVSDIVTGTATAKDAFRTMALSILDAMMKVVASKIAQQFISMALSFLPSPGGAPAGGVNGAGGTQNIIGDFSFLEKREGGFIRAAQGRAVTTRDSVPILGQPGEYMLRKSAVDAIGRDKLDQINALGNRAISEPLRQMPQRPEGEKKVNVWVVGEKQVPPPGPDDIVAIIGKDITEGGNTKQLIKSVNMGHV